MIMLSEDFKQKIVQLPMSERLELIQAIAASLQTPVPAPVVHANTDPQPMSRPVVRDQVNSREPRPKAPTLEELNQLVREVVQESQSASAD